MHCRRGPDGVDGGYLRDLHHKGQQVNMASLEAVKGGVEPEATMAEEVIVDREEEEAQVEEGLLEECPATPVVKGP